MGQLDPTPELDALAQIKIVVGWSVSVNSRNTPTPPQATACGVDCGWNARHWVTTMVVSTTTTAASICLLGGWE